MKDIFYFIGYMGAGKSTLARRVGEQLEIPWIDLDQLIEEACDMDIPTIFREEGEDYFREMESVVLQNIPIGPILVATGGGTPCSEEHWNQMSKSGHLIYLEAPFRVLYDRIKKEGNRPLLRRHSKNTLHDLFEDRLQFYEQAEYQIDVSRPLKEIEEDLVGLIWNLLTESMRERPI